VMRRLQRHATGFAARRALVTATSAQAPLKYYSAWFCPFAHRATLALEHHAGAVPYVWEEALGWEQRAPSGEENFSAGERTDWWYHWKSPGLLKANPLGMVPTLLDEASGKSVHESLVCIEFIDELAAQRGSVAPPLLPPCPFDRARSRVAADRAAKSVCSSYYKVLVRTDPDERQEGFEEIKQGLLAFTRERVRQCVQGGPLWNGATLGLPDCVLLPYAYRLYVLEHYRGPDFRVPREGAGGLWEKYTEWLETASALDCVAHTLPNKERYLAHVAKYAEGKARSKVGNAVRRGVAAHSYDDTIDGDSIDPKQCQ